MLPKLVKAEYKGGFKIWLSFSDNTEGEIDLEQELWGEVFEPLKDVEYFAKFKLDHTLETLVWPNGADFAPEFLYQQLRPDYNLKPTLSIDH